MKRKLVAMVVAVSIILSLGMTTWAAGGSWQTDGFGWWYMNEDGSYPANQWAKIDGNWYHFNGTGYMQTGWLWDGAWYLLDGSGVMQTGWIWDGFNWYFMRSDGSMHTGWLWDGGSWYYLNPNGTMHTGWLWDGAWYYMDVDGIMYTGWLWDGVNWYYLEENGVMLTGDVYNDETGIIYFFSDSGVYLGESEYFYHDGYDLDFNTITFTPNWVYYKNGRVVMEATVANGFVYPVRNIRVTDFQLFDAYGRRIADGNFGYIGVDYLEPLTHTSVIFTYDPSYTYNWSADLSLIQYQYYYLYDY